MAAYVSFPSSDVLASLLKDIPVTGNMPLTLESTTMPHRRKTSRKTSETYADVFGGNHGEVCCVKREYVSIGLDYATEVNRQREKEGLPADFVSKGLSWGQWYGSGKLVIEHKGEFYLRYTLRKNANYKYSEKTWVFEDGTPLTDEQISIFLEEFADIPAKDSGRQGTEVALLVRNVKFEGVTRLVFNKTSYVRAGYETREELESILAFHLRAAARVAAQISATE